MAHCWHSVHEYTDWLVERAVTTHRVPHVSLWHQPIIDTLLELSIDGITVFLHLGVEFAVGQEHWHGHNISASIVLVIARYRDHIPACNPQIYSKHLV